MQTTVVQGNGMIGRWSPPRYVPPPAQYGLGKPATSALGAPVSGAEVFFRSPVLALMVDVVGAGASAYLAWGLNHRRNRCLVKAGAESFPIEKCPGTGWSTFWWIMATAMGVKALHDLSLLNA